MKAEIHPKIQKVRFVCSCGESGDYVCEAFSTIGKNEVKVEVCSYCHPFYTGKQRIVDTGGRVEKFMKKQKAAAEAKAKKAPKKTEVKEEKTTPRRVEMTEQPTEIPIEAQSPAPEMPTAEAPKKKKTAAKKGAEKATKKTTKQPKKPKA